MMRASVRIASDVQATARVCREIVGWLFGPPVARDFAVHYPDGSVEDPPGVARFTLVLRRPGALRRMLLPPTDLAFGEAYLRDDFDVEGDIEAATGLASRISGRLRSPAMSVRLLGLLHELPADDLQADGAGHSAPRLSGRRHSRGWDAGSPALAGCS